MNTFCDCSSKQREDGSTMCTQCHGDFYACECPRIHLKDCENAPPTKE